MLCFESDKMNWYYHVLARRPYLVVTAIAVNCVACIIVALCFNKLPDFTDPTLGFETRGTEIGKRLTAWHNLLQESDRNGALFSNPSDLYQKRQQACDLLLYPTHRRRKNRNRMHKNKRRKQQMVRKRYEHEQRKLEMVDFSQRLKGVGGTQNEKWRGDSGIFRDYEITNDTVTGSVLEPTKRSEHFEYGHNTTSVDEETHRERVQTKKSTWLLLKQAASLPTSSWTGADVRQPIDGYFCDASLRKEYAHFVVQRIGRNSTNSLFDLNGLLAMCQLQEQIAAVPSYDAFCELEKLTSNCCRPWSLPNYAALLANRSSCFDLTGEDVTALQSLLLSCYDYYHDLKMDDNCNKFNRCYAPVECMRNNIVYNILHFLSDLNFIKPNDTNVYLNYAMIFVPVVKSNHMLKLFHEWEKVALRNELVEVVAMDLGLENELFNELLVTDVWLVALGGIFVMTCVWLYTSSLFITVMSCLAIFFSLGLAYFLYTLVLDLSFFPYMNLLAVVVIIGIGADDVFLFLKIWQCVLAERFTKTSTLNTQATLPTTLEHEHTETLQNLMSLTMRHAAASMFVTSVTTAGAFYASYISSITAIKCFGIFSGTVVVANYLLMLTWLPASVSIMERLFASSMTCQQQLDQKLLNACKKSINKFYELFEDVITQLVMNYAYFWLLIFGALGALSGVIVLWYPGLQLPEKSQLQLFVSQHPFEIYNTRLKQEFWFEKPLRAYENFKMHMRFVWGVQPLDDGDYTNPTSYGNLYYDNNFDISSKAAQTWLLEFCRSIRRQPFYQHSFGILLPNCFIENFIDFMERRCIDGMDDTHTDRTPCCDAQFPYEPHIFKLCVPQSISDIYDTPRFFQPGVAGPKFAAPVTTSICEMDVRDQEFLELNSSSNGNLLAYNATMSAPPQIKAVVIEFESNVSYSTIYTDIKQFYETVEQWFHESLSTAPKELQNGWFISDLNFFNVQDTLPQDTIISIALAMGAAMVVLLLFTLNLLIALYAVLTVSLTIFNTVAVLILLGWKLNVLESIAVSTAIGLAVDFSLHYGIHYRLSPSKERLAATQFALSRIVGPTVMAACTTGFAGCIMLSSSILPYIQIGIFLVVVMIISWLYATFFLMSLLRIAGPQYGFMQLSWRWPKCRKRRHTTNSTKFYERKPSQVIASEQLLTPTSSAIVELANSETHELESLNSNSLIKTISGAESGHALAPLPLDFEHSFQVPTANIGERKYQSALLKQEHYPSTSH
ncbi:protein dispatched [Scaptodrosophila lebanonensis]|uniref:Protein dispatched n=1 Tax=Drosophila lebanonensis TaxID=7225 RepID=A0A6J2TNJ0_DROLE|nr:protein dispatched [Scaptodrosophila lebanonensis]